MRILINSSSLRMLINFRIELLKEILKRGHSLFVTGTNASEADLKIAQNLGIEYFQTSIDKDSFSIFADIRYFIDLVRIVKHVRPDIIFGITHKPAIYGSLAGYFSESKVFSMLTGLGYAFSEEKAFKRKTANILLHLLYRICLKRNCTIVFQNHEDREEFERNGLKPRNLDAYVVDGSGVDLRYYKYSAVKTKPFKFLMMSRLIEEKGVREYLMAAEIIKEKHPEVEFHLLGAIDTNPKGVTLDELLNWEMKSVVTYHSEVRDVRAFIKDCTVFVLPSYYREGVPHSVLEAMSMGRPVITCNSVGCKETILLKKIPKKIGKVIVGENGLLVPPRDVETLAKAMEYLITNRKKIDSMSRVGYKYTKVRFDVKKVNMVMLDILQLGAIQKKKILINSSSFRMLLNFRTPLLEYLKEKGYSIYATGGVISDHDKELCKKIGIQYITTNLDRAGTSFFKDLLYLKKLCSVVRDIKPDVILGITHKPIVYGSLAGLLCNAKIYSSIEGLGYAFSEEKKAKRIVAGFVLKMMYRLSLRKTTGVIFQNRDDLGVFMDEKLVPNQVKTHLVNGTGVDLTHYRFVAMPKGRVHFLLVARMISEKGVGDYAEAARIVKMKYPDVIFDLVGPLDPNPKSIKMNQILEWQQKDYVTYHGEKTDVRKFLKNASVMVLPSYYREGIPRTLMEALSTGRPIITTNSVGCRETMMRKKFAKPDANGIEKAENGFLVPTKNPQALATAMLKLFEDRELMKRMARKSREYAVKRYDVKKVNYDMLKILGE